VFSPFTGVGSEGYCAVKMNRRFIGSELKKSYYEQAIKNLSELDLQSMDLFAA
jgi:DNA modification methylase